MIPNEHLIRAVLDGKQVRGRFVNHVKWGTYASPREAISALLTGNSAFEFELVPEVKKVWFVVPDNNTSISSVFSESAIDMARFYSAKLYRVEIDATTGEPLGVYVEDVE